MRYVPLILLAAAAGSCQPGATRWEEFPAAELDRLVAQDFILNQPQFEGPTTVSVPSSESGGAASHLFVTVEINGLPASLLVDTGGARTLLFPSLASRARLRLAPVRAETRLLDELVTFNLGEVRELRIGQLLVTQLPVFVARRQLLRAPHGIDLRPMDGMLGLDFLRRFAVTLDYDRRSVEFRRESRPIPDGARGAPVEIKKSWGLLGLHGWTPRMECRLDDSGPYPCIFDSGMSSSEVFVPRNLWKESEQGLRLRIGTLELRDVPAQPWDGDVVQFGPAVLIDAGWTRVTLDSIGGRFVVERATYH